MNDYILLMHDDIPEPGLDDQPSAWERYFSGLHASGGFQGGSEIGEGVCLRKSGPAGAVAEHITGYIRVQAESLEAALKLVSGNPVFEAGGTVEVRELPRS